MKGAETMSEVIISALISASAAIIVGAITQWAAQRKTSALIAYRLSELEKKVDKHNNLVERTYALERVADLHDEKIRVANHRIDDLEKGGDRNA